MDSWQTEAGLPELAMDAILETSDGYLWVGTQEGLARFDGAHFTVFDHINTPALRSDFITKLVEDRQNSLWIGTSVGLVVRHEDGRFERFGDENGPAYRAHPRRGPRRGRKRMDRRRWRSGAHRRRQSRTHGRCQQRADEQSRHQSRHRSRRRVVDRRAQKPASDKKWKCGKFHRCRWRKRPHAINALFKSRDRRNVAAQLRHRHSPPCWRSLRSLVAGGRSQVHQRQRYPRGPRR